jgi:hypothetical protein
MPADHTHVDSRDALRNPIVGRIARSLTRTMVTALKLELRTVLSSPTISKAAIACFFEQLFSKRNELFDRKTAMPFVHRLRECVGDSGAYAD